VSLEMRESCRYTCGYGLFILAYGCVIPCHDDEMESVMQADLQQVGS
jgi:hypothetical protein